MSKRKRSSDYSVGYGKPPKHTQFKRGQSGNPKGRPKMNTQTMLDEDLMKTLKQRVDIMVNGKIKSMTKSQILCEKTVNDAIAGTIGLKKLVFERVQRITEHKVLLAQQAEEEAARNAPKEPVVIRLRLGDTDPNRPIIDSSISDRKEKE